MLDLENRALQILNYPENFKPLEQWPEDETVFRIWKYPGFGQPYSTWILREKKEEFYVRRLEWDRPRDYGWMGGKPTIYGSESPVPANIAIPIVQRLRDISLPPFIKRPTFGIDGIKFGVEMRSFSLKIQLSWWYNPPDEWKELASWFDETVETLDSLLPEGTARMKQGHF
ncbi:MAG TPA: hypothetical protein VEF04_19390 [Blastocatellia bacterium]|nr:hypothetical protein [Blastocatellia bacterium]